MNLRKTRLATRIAAMTSGIVPRRVFPCPLGFIRAIVLWLVSFIGAIAVVAGIHVETDARIIEFIVGLLGLFVVSPVLWLVYLCQRCDWDIAMIAYGLHAVALLTLAKTSRRRLQAIAATIIVLQSFVGIYGLCKSI